MTISMARSAIQAASSGATRAAAPAAAAGAGGSGKESERRRSRTPTLTPIASVTLSVPTSACSATPATGISVNESTRIVVSGLPRTRPAKKKQ